MLRKIQELTYRYSILRKVLLPAILLRRRSIEKKLKIQKKVVQNLEDLLVGDPILQVDEFSGKFTFDIRSDLFARLLIKNSYEPELSSLCIQYLDPERDVIDVGANIGLYSILFAKNMGIGRVLAVEPTPNAINRLRQNLKLNNVEDRVEIFEGVASDKNGSTTINIIQGKEEFSSIGEISHPSIDGEQSENVKVDSLTLDSLVEQRALDPGFIKADVEGSEHLFFSGSKKVLSKNRPIILSELSDFLLRKNGSSADSVIQTLRKFEYEIMDPMNPSIRPGRKEFGDMLCIPTEKMKQRVGKRS